jgi:hypothetical protein
MKGLFKCREAKNNCDGETRERAQILKIEEGPAQGKKGIGASQN